MNNLVLKESITVNVSNENAVDINLPLPFLDWMQYFVNITSDPNTLLKGYKEYVIEWFRVNKDKKIEQQNIIKELYVSLYQTIALNYLTQEEKRFISTVDTTNSQNQQMLLPLVVSKLKQVCLYYVQLREAVKQSTIQHNIKSSPFSIIKIVQDELVNSFLDPILNQLLVSQGVTLDSIAQQVQIDIENLYDTETNYFDISVSKPTSAYQADSFEVINSSYNFDSNLFINFDASIVQDILGQTFIVPEFGNNFSVTIPVSSTDLSYLPDSEFINLINNADPVNLNLNTLKQTLQTYSGTDFYYLSTDSSSNFKFGKLFNANKFANYLNRRFPTTVAYESDLLKSENQIGLFFTPNKQGILNFITFNLQGTLVDNLSANYVYVFPDPNIYGNISGLSQTKFETPFIFAESVNSLKDNNVNSNSFGRVLSDYLTKFKGYQSRSETLQQDTEGASRAQDQTEFFTTDKKNVWSHADVFPLETNDSYPLEQRQQTLLVRNNKVAVVTKSDIFNNEFILFKEIKKAITPADFVQNIEQIIALTLDNHTFYDLVSGYNFDYNVVNPDLGYSGVTLTCPPLSTTTFDYYIPAGKLLSQQQLFNDPFVIVAFLDASSFVNTNVTRTNVYDLSSYAFDTHANIGDGSKFLVNGVNIQEGTQSANFSLANYFINLSGNGTILCDTVGTLSADIQLSRQHIVPGELIFRNYNNTIVTCGSAILSALFVKYPTEVQDELNVNLYDIDIIGDTLFCETENYFLFEKLNYNTELDYYTRVIFNQNYITKQPDDVYTNIWYNQNTGDILLGEISFVNEIFTLNLYKQTDTLTKIVSSQIADLNTTALSSVYISTIDVPRLTYNIANDTYLISFLIKDTSNYFFPVNYQFKLDRQYNIYNVVVNIVVSDINIYSESFIDNQVGEFTSLIPTLTSESGSYTLNNDLLILN